VYLLTWKAYCTQCSTVAIQKGNTRGELVRKQKTNGPGRVASKNACVVNLSPAAPSLKQMRQHFLCLAATSSAYLKRCVDTAIRRTRTTTCTALVQQVWDCVAVGAVFIHSARVVEAQQPTVRSGAWEFQAVVRDLSNSTRNLAEARWPQSNLS
jgi:hypothetical protein